MKNLINALSEISTTANFGDNSLTVSKILEKFELSDEIVDAIKRNDRKFIEGILGKENKIVCLLVPAKEDDDSDDDGDDESEIHNRLIVNY